METFLKVVISKIVPYKENWYLFVFLFICIMNGASYLILYSAKILV